MKLPAISATLNRVNSQESQTIGVLLFNKIKRAIFTLELPWRNNQRSISCIPRGTYVVYPYNRRGKKEFKLFELDGTEVNGRSGILIHSGNYTKHTQGCILPGLAITDLNGDGNNDVSQSNPAMELINEIAPKVSS